MGMESFVQKESFVSALEASQYIRNESFQELGTKVFEDLILPIPFSSAEDLEENMMFELLAHLISPM